MDSTKKVIIFGATGLVGQKLTRELLKNKSISLVRTIGRSASKISHPKLDEVVMDLDLIHERGDLFDGIDAVFCCLGTTMRQAKDRSSFRRIDFEYPLLAAKTAFSQGVTHFLAISAKGASTKSPFFYSKVKGELENVLRQIAFKRLTIIRPGLLLGRKTGQRPLEDLAALVTRGLRALWPGSDKKYFAVEAKDVATSMVKSFLGGHSACAGLEILEFKS